MGRLHRLVVVHADIAAVGEDDVILPFQRDGDGFPDQVARRLVGRFKIPGEDAGQAYAVKPELGRGRPL